MSDSTVARSNNVAQTQGTADRGVSRATLDQMKAGEVSSGDAQASKRMDFAKMKALIDKMQQLQMQHQSLDAITDGASRIRSIKG